MKTTKCNFSWRRFWVMCLGCTVSGIGIGALKMAQLGNDPHSAFIMAVGDIVRIDFSIMLIAFGLFEFVAELLFGRHLIGVGSIVNWLSVGPCTTAFLALYRRCGLGWPTGLPARLAMLAAGLLITSLGVALYQGAQLGVSPYDSLSLILSRRLPVPYFWCRMLTDGVCALCGWLLGGLIGVGCLVCAFGLGPFIAFFTRTAATPLCGLPAESTAPAAK